METETFTLHGKKLEDGGFYVTSQELPGFRLIVKNEVDAEQEVIAALRQFYPLYKAAAAKAEARHREPRVHTTNYSHHQLDMSAEFA